MRVEFPVICHEQDVGAALAAHVRLKSNLQVKYPVSLLRYARNDKNLAINQRFPESIPL
jgi:hypothetical protein